MRIVRHFSVSAVFFFLSIVITTAFAQQKELAPPFLQNNIDQNWLQQVKQHIEHSEYFIQRQENESAYQSPNRAQNLRFTYYENGFKVQPHTDGEEWQVEFRLKTVDRGEKGLPIEKMVLSAEENKLKATSPSLDIQYQNDKNGMRQDFIIKVRPDGKNNLRLNFAASLDKATLAVKPSEVIVASKKKGRSNVMRYSDLKVWDRNGKHLKAWMEKTRDDAFAIVVDDRNAEYPVTVDPISTPWYVSGNQSNALLGWRVGTAGDVNGDGYADVIIGAYGKNTVYVYYGHSGGLSPANSPDWTATGSGDFGFGVGTAGNVNGNTDVNPGTGKPCDDVIISALSSNTVYIYHGHSSGLSSSPDWNVTLTGKFGWGVGTAGDINGDGYSDVIVGARDYDDLGAAFIYHGSSTGLSYTPATTILGPEQSPPREDTYTLGGPSPYPYLSYFGLPVGCAEIGR
ncbi:MAG: hypothetical protein HGB11_13045, partial [Chlorobiales bacterium]|nr:hypothetical protein [Chlorobiales bacterium]